MPQHAIPEIIDEQDVARLLENKLYIVESLGDLDPAAMLHLHAQQMAEELRDHLHKQYQQMVEAGLNGADQVAILIDYARQLQAHHLDKLDRLSPA